MNSDQNNSFTRPSDVIARGYNPHWKSAQSLTRWITPEQFDEIITLLRRRDDFINDVLLDNVLFEILRDTGSQQRIKEFLIKSHALSVLLRDKGNLEEELEIWYVPNLSLQVEVNEKILSQLKKDLLGKMPLYRNKTSHGISVYYLKRDYGAYLARTRTYDLEKVQIRIGVVIASLYDALLARSDESIRFINQYFNDDMKGKYNIISGDLARKKEMVANDMREVLRFLYRFALKDGGEGFEGEPLVKKNSAWTEVYHRLSLNPATRAIRDSMTQTIERFIITDDPISEEQFQEYLKDLADIYMNTFEIEKLKDDEYKARIVKVIQYIYSKNMEICAAIKGAIEHFPVDNELVDAFIYWVVEISLKIHQEFLNSLIKKYNLFYYLYIRSYFAHRGLEDWASSNSFFIILRNLFCIKESDSRLVRGVLARNPILIP